MVIRQYTAEQLFHLRDSPLVHKPANLPAIEQWIEYVYLESDGVREKLRIPHSESQQQHGQKESHTSNHRQHQRSGINAGSEDSPMGSFSTGQRPNLMHMRSAASRGSGGKKWKCQLRIPKANRYVVDDVSLGPPRTMFPSSSRVTKLSDFPDRSGGQLLNDAVPGDEPESARSRFFSERQLNRKNLTSDKEGKDARDSRNTLRERRGQGDNDEPKYEGKGRFGRHDAEQDSERRNGFGDRHDPRWSSNKEERRPNGDRVGGWREREYQRRERDGDRKPMEKEPEWMDDSAVKKDQELGSGMARTQEEFQKWKDDMNKRSKGQPESEEVVEMPEASTAASNANSKSTGITPLKLDGLDSNMVGNWGAGSTTNAQNSSSAQNKATPGKTKVSRYASMFKPSVDESPSAEEPSLQKAANGVAKTSAEDQEGFNRVLQMLGSTKLGRAQTPGEPMSPPSAKTVGSNGSGNRPRSRFTDLFEQKSPERLQSPPQAGIRSGSHESKERSHRNLAEDADNMFGGRLPERHSIDQQVPRTQKSEHAVSPEPTIPYNALREQQQRPPSGRMEQNMFDRPQGGATPDINIQNLLAQQRQRQQATSNESQQLLNLLKKDSGGDHRPPSQQAVPGNGAMTSGQFQRWLESQQPSMPPEPHAPKPRMPQPPGLFEEQLMRNFPSEQARQDQTSVNAGGQDMPQRHSSQRVPPGYFDEQSIFIQQQQQRRNFGDSSQQQQQQPMSQPARRGNAPPNLPPMQIPPQQGPPFPPDLNQFSSPGGQNFPPPGFNPIMPRHPPGFTNMPNMSNMLSNPPPQQQQQQQLREPPPPGFGGRPNAQNPMSPTVNAPPGFFGGLQNPPPGFMSQIRSPTDGMPPPSAGAVRGNAGRGFERYDMSVGMGTRR